MFSPILEKTTPLCDILPSVNSASPVVLPSLNLVKLFILCLSTSKSFLEIASFFGQFYSKTFTFETEEEIQEVSFKREFEDICVGKVVRREDIKTFPHKLVTSNDSSLDVLDTSKK